MALEMRNVELRELLHVQVAAAAAISDGGKAFKAIDKALGGDGGERGPAAASGIEPGDLPMPDMGGMSEEHRERLRTALAAASGG